MFAMSFLQEGPSTNLVWLFYGLLAFLLLVIVVGVLASREKPESDLGPKGGADEATSKPKLAGKTRRVSSKRKSK